MSGNGTLRATAEAVAFDVFPNTEITWSITPLSTDRWHWVELNSGFVHLRMTTAEPGSNQHLVVIELQGKEESSGINIVNIVDSVSAQGIPNFSPQERVALGLVPERRPDAQELVVTVDLGQTFSAPAFPVEFDYPAGNAWNTESASSTSPAGGLFDLMGSPAIVTYQSDGNTIARVNVFVQLSPIPPGTMLDSMSFWGASTSQQYYQGNVLIYGCHLGSTWFTYSSGRCARL